MLLATKFICRPQGVSFPKKGKSGKEPKIAKIAAGGYSSFAITDKGDVYAWGLNNCGQLGLGNKVDTGAPTLATALSGKKITAIETGLHHTIALATDGRVYSVGRGDYGQLGRGDTVSTEAVAEIGYFTTILAST